VRATRLDGRQVTLQQPLVAEWTKPPELVLPTWRLAAAKHWSEGSPAIRWSNSINSRTS